MGIFVFHHLPYPLAPTTSFRSRKFAIKLISKSTATPFHTLRPMSGLEIAASVAAVVTTYSAIRSFVKDVKQVRKEREKAKEENSGNSQNRPRYRQPTLTHSSCPFDDDPEKEWGTNYSNVEFARYSKTPRRNNERRPIKRHQDEFTREDSDDEAEWG